MSKYIDADRLRAEIERLENEGAINKQKASENNDIESYVAWDQQEAVMGVLIRFIDSLQQEQPSSSDLDEAAQKVEDYYDVGDEHGYLYCHRGDIKDAFKAGAKWQYQKDRGEFAKIKAKTWCEGFDDAVSRFVKIPYTGERWFSTTNGEFIAGALFEGPIPADDVELYYRRRTSNESKGIDKIVEKGKLG